MTSLAEVINVVKTQCGTIIIGFVLFVFGLKVRIKEVGKCGPATQKFLVRADLGNFTVHHHNDLIHLRQKADAMCHQDACL